MRYMINYTLFARKNKMDKAILLEPYVINMGSSLAHGGLYKM